VNAAAPGLDALLATKEMVLVAGSGGVGKTTVAAALAASAAANLGGRVLVLTVDPARRLADALGVGALGNAAARVPDAAFSAAGVRPRGELWAAMLDTKAGWDELIQRHAPDEAIRDAVLSNPLYRNITSRFVHSHDYLAMERLHELHASGEWDLVVVDTPPSRNALDVLDAPGRMREFFGSRLLRWLTVPYRSRLFTAASKPFYQVADRVLGSRFLQDIADFFLLFQAMEPTFVAHANEVEALLADPRSTFVVVSTLETAPAHEAAHLARELTRRGLHLGAVIANRVLPTAFTGREAERSADRLVAATGPDAADGAAAGLSTRVAERLDAEPGTVAGVLGEIGRRFHDVALVATREAERLAELGAFAPLVVSAPVLDRDPTDVSDLLALADHLRRDPDPGTGRRGRR
jgi:anion-transporting  ArsA/GET3 family ATPase